MLNIIKKFIAATLFALLAIDAQAAVQHGTKYEYSDFLETLDNGEKFVGRKMLTYKKTLAVQ